MGSGQRVLVLAVHPASVAATRLRVLQHIPHLANEGFVVDVRTFLRERDLPSWYGRSQLRRALVAMLGMRRSMVTLLVHVRRADVVLVQREAMPLGPPLLELLAARGRRLVWDVDDALWESFQSPTAGRVPQWVRATGGKYARLCRRADEVWAGSEVLATWCRRHSDAVQVVPTVVPVPDRRPPVGTGRSVGWIGSHSTGPFLEDVLPAVAEVRPRPIALVVGARVEVPDELPIEVLPWSQSAEDSVLARTRVGLYPVDRSHPLAEGKCGLKGVLYMSHGIPSVVTPTKTNAAVVRDEVEGLHADTPQEWTAAVQRLLDDDDLWTRMSAAAHERARRHYSSQVWGPRLAERLRSLAETS